MIRTYFWHDRVLGWKYPIVKAVGIDVSRRFKTGNAGDIYTKNVLSHIYNEESVNCKSGGSRILTVGSILHLAQPNDVICGAGVKSEELIDSSIVSQCHFYGVRGPMSYDVLKKRGADLSNVGFLFDPGLMIRYLYDFKSIRPILGKKIFIPHYRERSLYYNFKDIEVVDIDDDPINIAKKICESEVVYTSSLHGVIFSHSLERVCILIDTQTEEPIFKYQDYFSSISVNMPKPAKDIYDAMSKKVPISPISLNLKEEYFKFPGKEKLVELGIVC